MIPKPATIGLLAVSGASAIYSRRQRRLRQLDQEADRLAEELEDETAYGEAGFAVDSSGSQSLTVAVRNEF